MKTNEMPETTLDVNTETSEFSISLVNSDNNPVKNNEELYIDLTFKEGYLLEFTLSSNSNINDLLYTDNTTPKSYELFFFCEKNEDHPHHQEGPIKGLDTGYLFSDNTSDPLLTIHLTYEGSGGVKKVKKTTANVKSNGQVEPGL